MAALKAILFDADGVILDTDKALVRCYQNLLKHFGYKLKKAAEILALSGNTTKNWVHALTGARGQKLNQLIHWTERRYLGHYLLRHAHLMPGAKEALQELHRRCKIALVTNMNQKEIATVIKKFHLRNLFDCIVDISSAAPKPSPAPLRLALRRLGVEAREALFVGDTAIDLKAGKAAKVKTIIFSHTRNASLKAPRIKSLKELLCLIRG